MTGEPKPEGSAPTEMMVARIQIAKLGDAVRQKEIVDAITALTGVREVTVAKGALHVTYDPLATTEKKIEEAVRSSGNTVKKAVVDAETPRLRKAPKTEDNYQPTTCRPRKRMTFAFPQLSTINTQLSCKDRHLL